VYILTFSVNLSETFLILKRIQRDIAMNVYRSLSEEPLILVIFQSNFNFLKRFSKTPQILSFMKNCQVGAEFFHADRRRDGWTDRHDGTNSRFLQFYKRA